MIGVLLTLASTPALGQSFFTYQTNGVNTFTVSFRWQQKLYVGLGYARRFGGSPFTAVQAEWRFPLQSMWRMDDQDVVFGVYKPLWAKRWSVAVGVHGRITRRNEGGRHQLRLGIATTVLPNYTYVASLNDGPYGAVGARATYEIVLAARSWGEGLDAPQWTAVPVHRVELGGHVDLHLERTLGVALNPVAARAWVSDPSLALAGEQAWQPEGDLTLGSTYYLHRW